MVCSFCSGPGHNVRTCQYLTVTINVFITNKGMAITEDFFEEELGAAGLAVAAGPVAALAAACYSAYRTASQFVDLGTFAFKSRREKAEFLLKNGFGFSAGVVASVAEQAASD